MSQHNAYPRFSMVLSVPSQLTAWWVDLGDYGQRVVRGALGHLPSLMDIQPCRDIIEAATVFWDEKRVVFRFGNIEMTPLLEEIGGYIENVALLRKPRKWQNCGMIIPRQPLPKEFADSFGFREGKGVECLQKSMIPLEYLYHRFGYQRSFVDHQDEFFSYDSWKQKRCFAFAVCFLGTIVFPKGTTKDIHTHLVIVTKALFGGIDGKHYTLVPMVVADIYRALGRCKRGYKHFEGCNLLLQIWLMEHLQKVNGGLAFQKPTGENHILGHVPGAILTAKSFEKPKCVKEWVEFLSHLNDDSMQWMFSWFPSEVLVFRTKIVPFLVLIGLRGLQPYAPLRVLRQSGRKQNIPLVADMSHYCVDYKEGKIPFAKEVIRMWKLKETTKTDSVEPNRYQAGCEDNYVEWLAADLEESIKPGVSLKDRIKDGEAEACILLRQLRKKSLVSEAEHHAQLKEKEREAENWKQQALSYEQSMQELDTLLAEQGDTCIKEGIKTGGVLAMSYLAQNRRKIDQSIRATKRFKSDEGPSSF